MGFDRPTDRRIVASRVLALSASSPGKKAWWNAKAGPAITVSISAEANVAAKNIFILLKANPFTLFSATVVYTPPYLCWII